MHPFIKKNGLLIIEDIYKNRQENLEENYYKKIKNLKYKFEKIYFVEFHNINNYTANWKNEKLLILIKK